MEMKAQNTQAHSRLLPPIDSAGQSCRRPEIEGPEIPPRAQLERALAHF
jgi:hypothetical protein